MPRWFQRFRLCGVSTFPASSFMVGNIAGGATFGCVRLPERSDWNTKHDDQAVLLRNPRHFQKLHGGRDEIGFPEGGDAMSP